MNGAVEDPEIDEKVVEMFEKKGFFVQFQRMAFSINGTVSKSISSENCFTNEFYESHLRLKEPFYLIEMLG